MGFFRLVGLLMLEAVIELTRSLDRVYCAGIFEQSMGTRNRVGIGLSYQPARLHMLAKLIA